MALDVRHMQLPIRPSSAPAAGMMIDSVVLAGGRGGKVERRPTFGSVSQPGRPRGRGTPSDLRLPNDSVGRECRSSASRVPLSSNATTTSHGLYKLKIVVIVDLRMLAMYFYFLINHIELS